MDIKSLENSRNIKSSWTSGKTLYRKRTLENGGCNVSYMQSCIGPSIHCISAYIKTKGCRYNRRSKRVEITYKVVDEDVIKVINSCFRAK